MEIVTKNFAVYVNELQTHFKLPHIINFVGKKSNKKSLYPLQTPHVCSILTIAFRKACANFSIADFRINKRLF